MTSGLPFFSVVIPSRNRPRLLREAVESVLAQHFDSLDVVVVNDGSSVEHQAGYEAIASEFEEKLKLISLVHYPRGHGPSYVINTGAASSTGRFVAFLDDDDVWTDRHHLQKAHDVLERNPTADLYLSNQVAIEVGANDGDVLWLGNLESHLESLGLSPQHGVYQVSVENLMSAGGFAHLNTMLVKRKLFDTVGGLDENIRWEGDRDFFLRLIDASDLTLFNPAVVAQHNVPDKTQTANITTATSFYTRMFSQLDVLNKAALFARHREIVRHARKHKVYALKRIAEQLYSEQRYVDAAYFSSQALGMDGSWKWWLQHVRFLARKWREN